MHFALCIGYALSCLRCYFGPTCVHTVSQLTPCSLAVVSAMTTPVTPLKASSALDDAWGKDASSRKKPQKGGGCRALDAQGLARKAIYDNCKSMTQQEVDGIVVGGTTLRQQIVKDKEANIASPGSVVMGKRYWDNLKRLYAAQDRTHKQLNAPEGTKVTDCFFKALTAAVRHPPNRSLLVQFAAASTTLCVADSIGIMKWLLTLNPVASRDQMSACLEMMRCLARCKVAADLPREMALMRDKFDEILLQACADDHS